MSEEKLLEKISEIYQIEEAENPEVRKQALSTLKAFESEIISYLPVIEKFLTDED